jgi:hypothetical protein
MILFGLSAVQALLFTVIGNNIIGLNDMMPAYWMMFFSVSCLSNVLGLMISSAMNSAVTIYILVPLLIIPQMILGGAMFSYEKLNSSIGGGYRVPLIASLMPSRWAYEALAVKQFKDNSYGKMVYSLSAVESRASWRQEYLYPELNLLLDEAKAEAAKSRESEVASRLLIIQNSLGPILRERGEQDAVLFSNPAAFGNESALLIRKKIEKMAQYDQELFNRAGRKKEMLLQQEEKRLGGKAGLDAVFRESHNRKLAEVVRRISDPQKLIRTKDRVECVMDPVYVEPEPGRGLSLDAHFYSPFKYFFGTKISTYRFNLIILWLMTGGLFVLLYFNTLKGFIKFAASIFTKITRIFKYRKA